MKLVKHYFLSCMTSLAIIILSVIPIPEVPDLAEVPLWDKWVHFVMYGGLSLVLWFDYCRKKRQRHVGMRVIALTWLYPVVLGGLLEIVQAYCTTCRSGDMLDFYADAIGACLGFLLGVTLVRRLRF
ncbi:MAG: VanZ family protein [Bacteroides sp.]|nr:VanZ family protein [Roseburia sp.]MCM1347548.1 VanZ family protein [Bacteroides sp.]MCM1420600.1 VanZ family protein [Bacteroides sp.]